MPARRAGRAPAILAAVALAYVAAAWVARPDLGFWSPDSSIRYVQLVSLVRQGYREVAAVYPGAELDPDGRFYPISRGFATARDGKVYLLYSPYFAAVTAPFYQAFGRFGLIVLPLLSGLAVVWLTFAWLRRFGEWPAAVGALLVGLGTPLVVYSVVFWDHAPVAALTTGAAYLLARGVDRPGCRGVAAAGTLLGLAAWFRNEAYVFAAAALVASALVVGPRRLAPLVGGFLLAAGIAWALNGHLYGHPLGLKGVAGAEAVRARLGGVEGWMLGRLLAAYDLLISTERFVDAHDPVRLPQSVGVACAVLLSTALLRAGVRLGSWASVLAAGAAVAVAVGWLVATGSEVMGLVPGVPALALLGLWAPRHAWERLVAWVAGLYVAGVVVLGSEGGLQWGPRYLLPAVPLLVWLVSAGVACVKPASEAKVQPALVACVTFVTVASLAVQGVGVLTVRRQLQTAALFEQLLRKADSPLLVTGIEPLFRVMGYLYFDRVLMSVESPAELQELVRAFTRHRVERWTYVPFSGLGFDARAVERWSSRGSWRFRVASDVAPPLRVESTGASAALRLITYVGGP
jgi:hypothetical protein